MKVITILLVVTGVICIASLRPGDEEKPLISNYSEVDVHEIRPKGWLLHQLQIMERGTTGHLDEVYNKVKNDNGWLGGKGDGWEETPYWLDGAVPLAYLLEDKKLQEKVLKYINWTLDSQRPSGYFGPITKWENETGKTISVDDCDKGEDWWPKMVMLKVLKQYYSATNDNRVITFMTKYFEYQAKALTKCKLGQWTEWAEARGMDNMLMVHWLYNITGNKSLLKLSSLLEGQTFPWSDWLGNRDWVIDAAAYQDDDKWMRRHGVNVGMGLKHPVVLYEKTGDEKYLRHLKTGFSDLMRLHGLPFGMYSADEDLHGNDPTAGTELCAIVEAQFSLEQVIARTGDPAYADALERMTFNALPTQTTDDYNNKQYYQVANQVQISKGVFNFSLPFREMNNVLGMRSGYTCCLANMHQGWTKYATHLWYKTPQQGLAAFVYGPCEITTQAGKNQSRVTIKETTNYPFDEQITFEFDTDKEVRFPFHLRIPNWCGEAAIYINDEVARHESGGKIVVLERIWKKGDKVRLQMPMKITTSSWGRNSRAVERGPLVYALKLSERWEKDHDDAEGDYFNVYPKNEWNYGLLKRAVDTPRNHFKLATTKPVSGDFIWNLEHAPIELTVGAKKIPGWKAVNGVASQPVTDRNGAYRGTVDPLIEKITLVPYGCTKVRIVAFPVVE